MFANFRRSGEYISYTGKLNVYERKTKPVVLDLKPDYIDPFLPEILHSNKSSSGNSVTEVYAELSKWFLRFDCTFQN
ncbi:MAG: hypothetical protein ABFS35_19205 [Bacteroidota bacterium]